MARVVRISLQDVSWRRTLKAGQEEERDLGLQELVSECGARARVHDVQQVSGKCRLRRPLLPDVRQKPCDDLMETLGRGLPRPHILHACT